MSEHYGTSRVPPGVYAPPPPKPQPIPVERLASFGVRAGAAIIDGVIVLGVTLVLLAALGAGFFSDGDVTIWKVIGSTLLATVLFTALAFLYAPLIMASTNGRTPGKMITGCRVVRVDGKDVTFGYAVLREVLVKGLLGGAVGTITGGLSYLADYLLPLADGQNRTVHDFIVDSRVVKA